LSFFFAAVSLACSSAASAAWQEARSKHFIIYADENPRELKALAEKLERFDQAVRYLRRMNDPDPPESGKVRIFLLRSEDDLAKLVGTSYIAGLYKTDASGSSAFLYKMKKTTTVVGTSDGTGTYDNSLMNTQIVFFHEYAHHLQLQDWSGVMPKWVSEGFAEFFATAEVDAQGNVTIGKFPKYRSWDVFLGGGLSAAELVSDDYKNLNFYETAALYGRAWLLTHYLTLSSKRRGQLNRYIELIESGKTGRDAAAAAFGDLEALDRELKDYIAPRELVAFTVDAKVLSVREVAIRALRPAEAAMMSVRIRQKYGVPDNAAASVAAAARSAAAPFVNDPFAQTVLAEAEFAAKNYQAADAAAGRALAVDANYVPALIYRGRSQLEIGRKSPRSADWTSVRSWFTRANKLDTENAEPLRYYYESFAAAGEAPTRNAVEGLFYAVELSPQDDWLRGIAVEQLLAENKLAEAQQLFLPLAYSPHARKEWQESVKQVLAAIAAGDGKRPASCSMQRSKRRKLGGRNVRTVPLRLTIRIYPPVLDGHLA
jgi:hypothetical protein